MNGWFVAYILILISASIQWAVRTKTIIGWLLGTIYSSIGIAIILLVVRMIFIGISWLFTG